MLACLALAVLASAAPAEVTQQGNVRVGFRGRLSPFALPRHGLAPVRVAVGATIASADGTAPPPLRRIDIEINRHGHFDPAALPVCRLDQIQPTTTADALEACRRSYVGRGTFSSNVLLPESAPFPSSGALLAFNGTYRGRPAILAHVYGTVPVPTSYTIPFTISREGGGFGTRLSARLPNFGSDWGYVTGLSLNLGHSPSGGGRDSYLSAGCPAPKGFDVAPFKFARAAFTFGGATLTSTLTRTCRASG